MASKAKVRARRAVDIREMMESRARALLRRRVLKHARREPPRAKPRTQPLQTAMQAAMARVQGAQ